MITELLGLAGSGIAGSVVGLLSDHFHRKQEIELERERGRSQTAQMVGNHVATVSASHWFGVSFLFVVLCYCACCFVCIYWPNVQLATFNPDSEPKTVSILFGLFEYTRDSTKVWYITSGGVGFSLLHPLAFAICSVLTGLSPMRRK